MTYVCTCIAMCACTNACQLMHGLARALARAESLAACARAHMLALPACIAVSNVIDHACWDRHLGPWDRHPGSWDRHPSPWGRRPLGPSSGPLGPASRPLGPSSRLGTGLGLQANAPPLPRPGQWALGKDKEGKVFNVFAFIQINCPGVFSWGHHANALCWSYS